MFDTIKLWFAGKTLLIALVIGSVLLASLGTMTFLYHEKNVEVQSLATANGSLESDKKALKANIDSLTAQIADEQVRHQKLEADKQKTFDDYVKRQADLDKMKNDKQKKAKATSNPTEYEKEVQKALTDYQNRMNCITGNTSACSRL